MPAGTGSQIGSIARVIVSPERRAGNSRMKSTVCFSRSPRSHPLKPSRGVPVNSIWPKSGALTTAGSRKLSSASHFAGNNVVAVITALKGKTKSSRSWSFWTPSLPVN